MLGGGSEAALDSLRRWGRPGVTPSQRGQLSCQSCVCSRVQSSMPVLLPVSLACSHLSPLCHSDIINGAQVHKRQLQSEPWGDSSRADRQTDRKSEVIPED